MAIPKLAKTMCIMAVLTILSSGLKAQLAANFNANPLTGCAPLVVSFHDLSTGNPTQWRWDLGNGTISFLQHPSVTYFNPGTYNVKLVITNAGGIDSVIKSSYIQVFASPVVNFSGLPLTGCYPLPVQFSDLSNPGSGVVNSWQWDFGDGVTSTLQNASHTYSASGNFNVSLKVSNSNGCFTTLSRSNYVHINEGVHSAFTHSAPNSCAAPVTINFQNQSTGTGILSYQWSFGDGATSSQANPVHQYNLAGNFNVQLITINATGCSDTMLIPSAIAVGTVHAGFNVNDTICEKQPVTFTNTSTPSPVSAQWSFGDGTTSNAINPFKAFASAGVYHVKLVSNFGACVDSVERDVIVLPKPHAAFQATDTASCSAPFVVNFVNASIGATAYEWSFGDGATSSQSNPVHTYLQTGIYTVSLIAINPNGCTDTLSRPQYITVQLPITSINSLPQQGCAPLSWTFSSTTTSVEPVTGYQWDFGDGSTGTGANPTHVFAAGNYNIQLIVTTASGCTDTVVVPNGIRAGIKPVPNFIATPREACAKLPITFTDLSTGTITQWHWDFGDGGTSTTHSPSHVYEDTGYFTIQLIVTNNGCSDTLVFPNYVHINPPIASFTPSFDCSAPFQYSFADASIGADEWHWSFGDGSTSTAQSPTHMYASPGMYHVSLTVVNHLTGCDYESSHDIQIVDEHADFDVSASEVCRNSPVTFNAINSNAAHISGYSWDFGDGSTGIGRSVSHTYTSSGTYPVTLIITDISGCKDTLTRNAVVRVNGPLANFGSNTSGSCLLSSVQFADSSIADGIHPIQSWTWNYGDGNSETLTSGPFQHTYASAGVFTVTLTVTDNVGCTDAITKDSLLTISHPVALFSTTDTSTCPGKAILFSNASMGPGLLFSWHFGDGATSTMNQPLHAYAADGIYDVSLKIVDQYGCTDSISKPAYIKVNTPLASFSVNDSVSTCPPLMVNFTNTSQHYTSFDWDFGDGTHSQVVSPSHFYAVPGTFVAKLTITGPGGCTSVKQQTIIIHGPYGSFSYGALVGCKPLAVTFRASTQNRSSFIWDFNDGTTITSTDSVVSHTYTVAGIYVPKMILKDAAGCMVPITGPDTIVVNGVNTAFDADTRLLCDIGTVHFSNQSVSNDVIANYSWDFGDGTTSTLQAPSHTYTAVGNYYPKLKVTTATGCVDSMLALVPVKVVKKPDAFITRTPDGCLPLTVTYNGRLNNADTSAIKWTWTFGNGGTSIVQNPSPQLYSNAGSFPVQAFVVNSSGCRDTAAININVFPLPNVFAGIDSVVCKGRGITIQATGAASYSWSPAAGLSCTTCASPVANPDSARNYIVTGRSAQGCFNKDTIHLDVQHPFIMRNSLSDTICFGSSLRLSASGADEYSWLPSAGIANPAAAAVTVSPKQSTVYTIIGRDKHHCFADTAFIPVKVYPIPTVEAGEDKTINVGQAIDLIPQISPDVTTVTWSPTGSIFRSDYPSVTVKPRETTRYTVEVSNPGGCTSKDDLTIYVICNGANVFIPNTFSPNADGANDVFYPRGSGLFSIKSFKVFNRWGELMYSKNDFQANDVRAGWDGRYKNNLQNPDVYVYLMEIVCDNNTVLTYKGNVALIR